MRKLFFIARLADIHGLKSTKFRLRYSEPPPGFSSYFSPTYTLLTHITSHIARVTLYPCLLAFSFFAASALVVKVEIPISMFYARALFYVISTLSIAVVCSVFFFGRVVCRSRVYRAFFLWEMWMLYHPPLSVFVSRCLRVNEDCFPCFFRASHFSSCIIGIFSFAWRERCHECICYVGQGTLFRASTQFL